MRKILFLILLIPVLVLSKDKQIDEPVILHTDIACFEYHGLVDMLKNKFGEDAMFVAKKIGRAHV